MKKELAKKRTGEFCEGENMILIIGGAFQGKLEFASKRFGIEKEHALVMDENELWQQFIKRVEERKGSVSEKPLVVYGLEKITRKIYDEGKDVEGAGLKLCQLLEDAVVISDDVSCGLVPMDKNDRLWREAHGRALGHLASKAEEVYRVFCGMAMKIKGDGAVTAEHLFSGQKESERQWSYVLEGAENWNLVVIRHGQTEGNVKKWYYGSSDLELTAEGRKELIKQRDFKKYEDLRNKATRFYHTGLKRTQETCRLLFGPVEAKALPLLREIDFGQCECKTYDEACKIDGFKQWIFDEQGDVLLPGGESKNGFVERVILGTSQIIDGGFGTQVVVCHGGVIANIMQWLFPKEERNFWDWIPEPGSGFVIEFEGRVPKEYTSI